MATQSNKKMVPLRIEVAFINLHLIAVIFFIIVNFTPQLSRGFDSVDDNGWVLDYDDDTSKQIRAVKNDKLKCQRLKYKTTFNMFVPDFRVEMDVGLRGCENYYTRVIEEILEDLGLIGRAIRIWLDILNVFALRDPSAFKEIRIQDIRTVPGLRSMLNPVTNRVNQDPDENYYLESAYLYGLGICSHLNAGPMFRITSDLLAFWRHGRILDYKFGVGLHEFVFLYELEKYRDGNNQLHMIVLVKTLANVCRSLARYPLGTDLNEIYLVTGLTGVLNNVFHLNLDIDHYRDGLGFHHIHNILGRNRNNSVCTQADYFRFRRGLTFFAQFEDEHIQEMITAGARSFVEDCYSRIASKLADDNFQLIPNDFETYVFSSMVRRELNENADGLHRMSTRLEMRVFMFSSLAERLFFEIPRKTKLVDASRSLSAYMDGKSGPCEFYARFRHLYQHRTNIFEMLEFFTILASLDLFWHPISNDATGFFFMWTICRESRLIDLPSASVLT